MSDLKTAEFKHIRLEPADNGFVLEYTEVVEKPGSMDDRDWNERQIVFLDNEDGAEGIDAALSKMKELYLFNKIRKGGNNNVSPPELIKSIPKGV